MAIPLHRIRPSRTTLAALAGLSWALSFGAARELVWADLRSGMIDLKGLSRSTRALVWIGFGLLGAMIVALLFNDAWRAASSLVEFSSSRMTVGRGSMIPVALIPATLFLIATAWAFALAGALHARRSVRLGVLLLYLVSAGGWVNSDTALHSYLAGIGALRDLGYTAAGWAALAAVPVFYLLRRGREARPALEFSVLFGLVAATFLLAQAQHLDSWRTMGVPLLMAMLEVNVATLQGLVVPLLLLIGVDIALFTHRASGWAAEMAAGGSVRGLLPALLFGVLAWRLHQVMGELAERLGGNPLSGEALQYAGALVVPLAAFAVWWGLGRVRAADAPGDEASTPDGVAEAAERAAVPLIVAFGAVQLVATVLLLFAQALPSTPLTPYVQAAAGVVSDLLNHHLTTPWHLLVNLAALGGAVWLARRGRRSLALYLGIFGVVHLWYEATAPGRPLAALAWRGSEPEDFWWTVLLAGFALLWAVRGRLTRERATLLLGLVVMTWLLRQTDLLDDPYSPFFLGYSGIGFLAFGIVWDALTAGSWANVETRGLPRTSRVLMYVGYTLLTVTVVNWALTSHDLGTVGKFTGDAAMVGLERFGKPLLYGVMVLTLALASRASLSTQNRR